MLLRLILLNHAKIGLHLLHVPASAIGARYPRFHCYIDEKSTTFTINLHLDQKQASYGIHTAHGGDYDGPRVEEEAKRIKEVIAEHMIEKKEVPVDTPTYDLSMFG